MRRAFVAIKVSEKDRMLRGAMDSAADQVALVFAGSHSYEVFGSGRWLQAEPCSRPSDMVAVEQRRRRRLVHFFVHIDGKFVFINNVNARVARFLDELFSRPALGFFRIETISGTTVRLQTVDFVNDRRIPRPENVDYIGDSKSEEIIRHAGAD